MSRVVYNGDATPLFSVVAKADAQHEEIYSVARCRSMRFVFKI
jgi:hypothetical protein